MKLILAALRHPVSVMVIIVALALGSLLAYWLIVHPAPRLAEND